MNIPEGETPTEVDATPDEAFDLGTVAGYDEGYKAARAELVGVGADLIEKLTAMRAERDALQAQLDSMTVERRPTWEPDHGFGVKLGHEQRLVGPWTVVPEDTK